MSPHTSNIDNLDWLSLAPDEEIIWSDTPHSRLLFRDLLPGALLVVALIGIPMMIAAFLRHKNTHYVITTNALYNKTGILSRNVRRIELSKVQDSSYRQSFWGTMFGYGTLDVSTAGGSGVELRFRGVTNPKELQSTVNGLIRRLEAPESTQPQDGTRRLPEETAENQKLLRAILQELRAIRTTLDDDSASTGTGETTSKRVSTELPAEQ